jgi:hypothetical protein
VRAANGLGRLGPWLLRIVLIGADGAVHRESFEVGTGVLLWNDDAMTFLLEGAGSKAEAMRLSAEADR